MKIKKVEILPIKPNNGLIGFAHIFLEEGLYLSSIGIFKKKYSSGYRILYPTKKTDTNQFCIFHPTIEELSKYFEESICEEAKQVFEY